MTIAEEKQALRARTRAAERALDDGYKARSSAEICRLLAALPDFAAADTVLAFFGISREIDTRGFLLEALRRGKTLLLPRCEPGRKLSLCVVRDLSTELERGVFGIPEPKRICPVWEPETAGLAVIPCTTFDRAGNRLGQGGGYYDRLLPRLTCPTVCVCRERLLAERVPAEAFDVRCSLYLTESGPVSFAPGGAKGAESVF